MCTDCIIKHIAAIQQQVKDQLRNSDAKELTFRIDPVKLCTGPAVPPNRCVVANHGRNFQFPGTSTRLAFAFVRTFRLLGLIHASLIQCKSVTSRDLYYQDVALFGDQRNVVNAITRLTKLLRIPRSMLSVMPAPNGLVAGDLTIALVTGEVVDTKRSNGSSLIPVQKILHVTAKRVPSYVLVVEKEAVFSYLQWELPEAIIVTGRGFPDQATRNLLCALATTYPCLPFYGLVDSDPHGILICRNYQRGSETSVESQTPLPIRYLGVSLLEYKEGLVPSTISDLRLGVSTLKKTWVRARENAAYKAELQRGLFMGLKSEMNLLNHDQSHRISTYIRQKIARLRRACRPTSGKPYTEPVLVNHSRKFGDLIAIDSNIDPALQAPPAKRPRRKAAA